MLKYRRVWENDPKTLGTWTKQKETLSLENGEKTLPEKWGDCPKTSGRFSATSMDLTLRKHGIKNCVVQLTGRENEAFSAGILRVWGCGRC